METRRIKELIADVLFQIKSLPQHRVDIQSLPQNKQEIAFFIQLESDVSCEILIKLLEQNKDDTEAANPENLYYLYKFLRERWSQIYKTDASYYITPDSRINQACIILAESLAKNNNQLAYDLLMPDLQATNQQLSTRGNISGLRLHEFILGDNGASLSVEQCYQYLEFKTKTLSKKMHSSQSSSLSLSLSINNDLAVKALSLEEEQLIRNHSKEASDYYDAIILNQDIDKMRDLFLQALRSGNYTVKASYGEEGKLRLATGILSRIQTPLEFAGFMMKHFHITGWRNFLKTLSKEILFKSLLKMDLPALKLKFPNIDAYKKAQLDQTDEAILNILSKANPIFIDEMHLRAFLFSLLEAYEISRREGPEFKSNTGYYVGYYLSYAYSKDDKISACEVYRNFLLSDHPLNDLEGYLRKKNLYDKHWGPLTTTSRFAYNTLPNLVALGAAIAAQLEKQKQPTMTTYGTLTIK